MGTPSTKDRMVTSAVKLLRERGVHGVTVDAVLADSGAPRGSVYHHFPGGRHELLVTAARSSSAYITGLIDTATGSGDPKSAVGAFVEFWRRSLAESDFRTGCPVAALASAGEPAELVEIAQDAFEAWSRALATGFEGPGTGPERALGLATMVITSIEGALLMCAAYRSAEPLETVAGELERMLA